MRAFRNSSHRLKCLGRRSPGFYLTPTRGGLTLSAPIRYSKEAENKDGEGLSS